MNRSCLTCALSSRLFGGLLASLVLLSPAAWAETLSGRVRDANTNSYLFGARVFVEDAANSTTTDREGRYMLRDLTPGTYTVAVDYLGYDRVRRTVMIEAGAHQVADFAAGAEVLSMEAYVVAGTREGQARALQQKLAAVNVLDVVSADSVGKLPDGNAAEALRRVPGISVEIDQDEGRYVVLRGIDSALNTVTLNNQVVGTPSEQGNRGVALDSVPADLIARLEVVKAVTPDMDGNAIGGSVNIVTQSAFDRPEGFLYATVSGFYDSFSERTTPNGRLTFGRLLGEQGRWGIVGGVSYSLKDFKSQTVNQRSWRQVNGFWLPVTQQSYDYDIERERIGANVALQFRPRDGHEFALRLNHNEFSDTEGRQSVQYEYVRGTLSNQTATSGANSQGRANRQFRDYHQTGTIDAASLEGRHELAGDTRLTWQVGASRGERDVPIRNDWEFRSSGSAFPNTYDLTGDVVVVTPTDAYYDPARYPFRRVRFRSDLEREDVLSAQADVQRALELAGRDTQWKLGAKFVSREKEDDRTNRNYLPAGTVFTLAEPGLAGPDVPNYFIGLFRFGPTLDMPAIEAFFAANPDRFALDSQASLVDSIAGDFDASEDVVAGYAMATVQLSPTWTLLAGARVEHTSADYGAYQLDYVDGDFTGNYRRVTGGKDYTHVLPGLHLAWRPMPRTVMRLAWTQTLGRPNYTDLAPRRTFDSIETEPGSGVYLGSLSTGNSDLEPYESMNIDLSLEYYFASAGIVSLGAFHKDIDNPVYGHSTFETDVTVDGRFYSQLSTSRPDNADRGRITGVELNYQQLFTFLPSPFDGLGFNVNYTLTDSSATLFSRADKLPFFKQADTIGNVALFYEKYGWEVRVAFSHTDDYLSDVGSNAETDIYIRSRETVDAKVSYRLSPRFRVFAELLNLTEEPLREFTGVAARENDFEIYEWKARFGVNFSL